MLAPAQTAGNKHHALSESWGRAFISVQLQDPGLSISKRLVSQCSTVILSGVSQG